jgi:hypothetical protein
MLMISKRLAAWITGALATLVAIEPAFLERVETFMVALILLIAETIQETKKGKK